MGRRDRPPVVGGHRRTAGALLGSGVLQDRSWSTAGQPGGVVLGATGEPVVASPEGLARARPQHAARWICGFRSSRTGPRTAPTTPRSTAAEGSGSARWPTTSGRATRRLYRVDGDRVTRVVDGLTISNGPAFDEPQGRLYLADTALCVVDVFDLEPATGALSGRRRFLDLSRAAALAGRQDRRR